MTNDLKHLHNQNNSSTISITMGIVLNGHNLSLETFQKITRGHEKVQIAKSSLDSAEKNFKLLLNLSKSNKPIYGVNTGFGSLKNTIVSHDQLVQLQINLLRSHAAGVGPLFGTEIVRGIMLLSLNCLAKAKCGVSPSILLQIAEYLNHGIHPLIPSQGSVGSSGDLAPASHFAITLIGEGEVEYKNKVILAKEALKIAGLKPVELGPKSGLALINGTHAMNSVGSHALINSINLAKVADIAAALTIEALKGTTNAFRPDVHNLRPHPTQKESAANIALLLKGSRLEKYGIKRELVQDAYSLRCAPQVHGASRQAFNHVKEVVNREYASITDNPLIINEEIISAGHFHGQPLAVAFDYLSIGLSELGNISERRIERLVNPQLSNGLPAFLVDNPGINSGFMITQYAAAAVASENKSLAHPASVDSIPTSANQEDHVSMGTIAGRKALVISENVAQILGIEIFAACQGLDLLSKMNNIPSPESFLSKPLSAVYKKIREHIPYLTEDRIMSKHMIEAAELVKSGLLVQEAESTKKLQ